MVPFGVNSEKLARCIFASSPGLSGSLPDTHRISRSPNLPVPCTGHYISRTITRKAHKIHFSDILWQTFGIVVGTFFGYLTNFCGWIGGVETDNCGGVLETTFSLGPRR